MRKRCQITVGQKRKKFGWQQKNRFCFVFLHQIFMNLPLVSVHCESTECSFSFPMQILVAVKTSTHKKVAWRQCINTVRLLVLLLYRISVYKLTYVPVRSSYMSTPSDQKSTDLSCPLLRMISGATYSGVPQNVHVFRPESMCLEKPKSTILMYPSLSAIKQIGSNCQKKV